MDILDHIVILFFIFCDTTILVSTVALPFYVHTSSAPIFPHLYQDFLFYDFFFFNSSHPKQYEVASHCGLICISLVARDVEHLVV